ncbi:hypothetical protein PPYR_04003 [Photinus pyralis]|uniref:G-protein coupled receptors family 1 profile domain-containing protein n=2 Tax=Photinus pyralis TaxID=7054 RepID=A0A5N4AWX3_PHOPY|nr:opsin, ultraviolet-sensitive-like [Photinus pyralis]KAB0801817.1 hypothetical protein PPYR_04003 [Photinus pyralis]
MYPPMNFTLTPNDTSNIFAVFIEKYPISSWKKYGFFDENYIKSINVHWLQFLPPNQINHYALAVLYVIIMIIGLVGNILVIAIFIRSRSLRTPANSLVMNLAISDALMMSKMPVFIFNSIESGPALGRLGCQIYGFLGGLSGTASICTLAAISLNRYYVIKFPLNMRFTGARSKICIALAWIYSVTFSSIPLLDTELGSYVPEGYLTSCSFDYLSEMAGVKLFILIFFTAAWLMPFTIITFCYIHIWIVVLETRNVGKSGNESSRNIKLEEKRRQDLKLAGTIFIIIILWFVAWTPYAVVALLGISNHADLITPLASMIPALFCKTASCIDPFVYALSNPKFKNEVKRCFFKGSIHNYQSSKVWSTRGSTERRRTLKDEVKDEVKSVESISEEVQEEIILVSIKS